MAKFIYRMQNILNIKYKLEDQAKTEFMLANRRLAEEEAVLETLRTRKAGYEEETRQVLCSHLDVDLIKELQEAIVRMQEFIRAQEQRVEEARRQAERAAAKLSELMQERKAQEKLKERAFEEFIQEENAKEGKEIDELVSYTYGKRQREE